MLCQLLCPVVCSVRLRGWSSCVLCQACFVRPLPFSGVEICDAVCPVRLRALPSCLLCQAACFVRLFALSGVVLCEAACFVRLQVACFVRPLPLSSCALSGSVLCQGCVLCEAACFVTLRALSGWLLGAAVCFVVFFVAVWRLCASSVRSGCYCIVLFKHKACARDIVSAGN